MWRELFRQFGDRPLIAALVAHVGRIEPLTLAAFILGASLVLAFASLANAVARGSTHAFDEWLIIALRTPGDLADPVGPQWLEEMMRDFTALGSTGVLGLMVLAIAGFLAMTHKRFAFPLPGALMGLLAERGWNGNRLLLAFLGMLLSNAVCLVLGAAWLAVLIGPQRAIVLGVIPFLAGALLKSALGAAILKLLAGGRTRVPS